MNASGFRIRRARADEHGTLEHLKRRASLADGLYREILQANPEAMDLPIDQVGRGQVLVAEQDASVVGLAVVIVEGNSAELDGLFVEPERWREGIGTALAAAAVHEARRNGLTLGVTAGAAAREFYEHCGFSVEGQTDTRFGPALRMSC